MILVDSSAWVEFLRRTGSPINVRVRQALDGEAAVCGPVRLEVLAGARDDTHLLDLERMLARAEPFDVDATDYDEAAGLYRACRRQGETVRRMLDCLIAAVAIREDLPVLHADRDFDVLARHTRLRVVAP